jgi:NDP-sugar pyrophosphorylase family protein
MAEIANMKVLLLAAGMGTRLRPLTNNLPKALIEINGKTLLERNLLKLKEAGFQDIIINLHYLPKMIIDFLDEKQNFGLHIEFSFEYPILDTGGAIKKAKSLLYGKDSFLVHNVDVLSDIDLFDLIKTHETGSALATLAVSQRKTNRNILFNNNMEMIGWTNHSTGELKISPDALPNYREFAFSGVQVVKSDVFTLFGDEDIFSIIDTYISISKSHIIAGYIHSPDHWFDVGKIEDIQKVKDFYFLHDKPEKGIIS